jgi:putative aldouronate transport system permease protein
MEANSTTLPVRRHRRMTRDRFYTQASFHLMLLPAAALLIVFSYLPLYGVLLAFKRYHPLYGILGSEWVGFANFARLFQSNDMGRIMFNTVYISVMKIVVGIVVPVTFALLLNELKNRSFVRSVQTIVYMPHFLSWVIMSGIVLEILSPSGGVVNNFLGLFGIEPIYFLGEPTLFPYILVATDTWKSFGFGTIIYLAALTSIDPALYEAAIVDGASHMQQARFITLPGIASIVVLMTVLSLGNLLNAGFDQVFNLINPQVYRTGEIIDLTVYRIGIRQANFAVATAVGLIKSTIGFVLILTSYKLADKYAGYRIF